MYHCHMHLYLAGCQIKTVETIKDMKPLEQFTHTFMESDGIDETMAAEADVIWLGLQGMDVRKAVQTMIRAKREETELIVLADKEQMLFLSEELPQIKDVWIMPMEVE